MYNLAKNISSYIELLKKEFNLSITLHDFGGHFLHHKELIEHNVHSNEYCMYVKTNPCVWNNCIAQQKKLASALKNGAFFGMCYLGVEEYVFPVHGTNDIIGFICVSGYRTCSDKAQKRLTLACEKYGFDYEQLKNMYENSLSENIPDFGFVNTLIIPLAQMIKAVADDEPQNIQSNAEYIYAHILSYIKRNYSSKITISDLCKLCHCSESYIMRIFKKISGISISSYINNFRVEKSKSYLQKTNLSVTEISYLCGFSDSNYFSNTFKKLTGVSPSAYRKTSNRIL